MLPTLQTPRLLLRALTLDDAAACVRICGQRIVAATTLRIPHPYSLADATAWLGTHPGLIAADKAAVFGITLDSTLIGTIGLTIDRPHARAELGYVIEPAHWGQGYATEAARAVVEHGLGPLALNRVFAWHVTRNPASGRVLAKAGLVHEGTQRRQFLKWGRFENAELFGIVRSASHAEPHAAPQLKPARFGEPAASPPPGPPSRRPIGSAPARRGDACNLRPLAPADRAIARAACPGAAHRRPRGPRVPAPLRWWPAPSRRSPHRPAPGCRSSHPAFARVRRPCTLSISTRVRDVAARTQSALVGRWPSELRCRPTRGCRCPAHCSRASTGAARSAPACSAERLRLRGDGLPLALGCGARG